MEIWQKDANRKRRIGIYIDNVGVPPQTPAWKSPPPGGRPALRQPRVDTPGSACASRRKRQ